jgi:hypothetical protein
MLVSLVLNVWVFTPRIVSVAWADRTSIRAKPSAIVQALQHFVKFKDMLSPEWAISKGLNHRFYHPVALPK